MKKVLIYVLTSGSAPYPALMQTSRETWDSGRLDGTETYYYSETQPVKHDRLVDFDVPGGLYDMGRKNLPAFRWALEAKEWDYLARVNASCYVVKWRLRDHVQHLPDRGVFQGVGAPRADGNGLYLWGGMQFILSRDVVQAIVDHEAEWDHGEMEDVAMSKLVRQLGYELNLHGNGCSINRQDGHWACFSYDDGGMGGFDFTNFAEFAAKNTSQFIRVKQDYDRAADLVVMRELYKNGV